MSPNKPFKGTPAGKEGRSKGPCSPLVCAARSQQEDLGPQINAKAGTAGLTEGPQMTAMHPTVRSKPPRQGRRALGREDTMC